jgi:hypothetical protein
MSSHGSLSLVKTVSGFFTFLVVSLTIASAVAYALKALCDIVL